MYCNGVTKTHGKRVVYTMPNGTRMFVHLPRLSVVLSWCLTVVFCSVIGGRKTCWERDRFLPIRLMGNPLDSFAANDVVFRVNFGLGQEKTEN